MRILVQKLMLQSEFSALGILEFHGAKNAFFYEGISDQMNT